MWHIDEKVWVLVHFTYFRFPFPPFTPPRDIFLSFSVAPMWHIVGKACNTLCMLCTSFPNFACPRGHFFKLCHHPLCYISMKRSVATCSYYANSMSLNLLLPCKRHFLKILHHPICDSFENGYDHIHVMHHQCLSVSTLPKPLEKSGSTVIMLQVFM